MANCALSKSMLNLRLLNRFKAPNKNATCFFGTSVTACEQQNKIIDTNLVAADPTGFQTSNKAARSYLERVKAHESFMAEKVSEFNIGRRHLANIMGVDHETFTQEDINAAIAYLLPSGLYEPKARPQMLHPEKVFPGQKEAQFDKSGRPFHALFYTLKPHFYQVMHDITGHMKQLDRHEDKMLRQTAQVEIIDRINVEGSAWFTKQQLEEHLMEELKDDMYEKFLLAMTRLCSHLYAHQVKEFIIQFRKPLKDIAMQKDIPEIEVDENGRRFVTSQGTRKTAKAVLKVLENGSGHFNINGDPITYFKDPQPRENLLMPLQICGLLRKVDIVANVVGGGITSQSGSLRYALAVALQAFVDEKTIEAMRLAGLLTLDRRRRERKKPGQSKARAKFTWKRR